MMRGLMQPKRSKTAAERARLEHTLVILSSLVWTAVVLLVLVFLWGYQDAQAQWQIIEHGEIAAAAQDQPSSPWIDGPPVTRASQVLPETPLETLPRPTATATRTLTPPPSATPTETAQPTRRPTRRPATPTVTPTATAAPTATPTEMARPTATAVAGGPDRLVIDSLGIDTPVIPVGWITIEEGGQAYSMWQVADFAAGWHSTSALPGLPGNTVISGHHNIKGEVFRYLADIQEGAAVDVHVGGATHRYYVEQKLIVKEKGEPLAVRQENARWIDHTDDVRLTLITCWPYTNNTHRVIVVARPHRESSESGE